MYVYVCVWWSFKREHIFICVRGVVEAWLCLFYNTTNICVVWANNPRARCGSLYCFWGPSSCGVMVWSVAAAARRINEYVGRRRGASSELRAHTMGAPCPYINVYIYIMNIQVYIYARSLGAIWITHTHPQTNTKHRGIDVGEQQHSSVNNSH